jgi:hypothetical protein
MAKGDLVTPIIQRLLKKMLKKRRQKRKKNISGNKATVDYKFIITVVVAEATVILN